MYTITWEQLSHCEHLDTSSLLKKKTNQNQKNKIQTKNQTN